MLALIVGMLLYKKPKQLQQETTLVTKQQTQPTAIPTVNPNALPPGNTDDQLDKDSQTLDESMSTIDASLQNVDTGLNDKATNLQ